GLQRQDEASSAGGPQGGFQGLARRRRYAPVPALHSRNPARAAPYQGRRQRRIAYLRWCTSTASRAGWRGEAFATMNTPNSTPNPTFGPLLIRWRGRQEGPYSPAIIEQKLAANEIGLLHEVYHNSQWVTLRDYFAE